jgi:hypothetical protein
VPHVGARRGLDQRAGLHGVGEIVAERVGDRFRHHDLGREMGDRIDPVAQDRLGDEGLVGHVADDEAHLGGQGPVVTGREIVEDHDLLMPGIDQREHHVAADIAGAARDQNRHRLPQSVFREPSADTCRPV